MTWCCSRRPPRRWTCTRSYAARGDAFAAAAARRCPATAGRSRRRDRHRAAGDVAGRAVRQIGPAGRAGADRPAPVEQSGRPGRTAGLAGRVGKPSVAAPELTADWLDRPMTSLHLVLAIFALMLGFGLLMVLSSSSVTAFRTGRVVVLGVHQPGHLRRASG